MPYLKELKMEEDLNQKIVDGLIKDIQRKYDLMRKKDYPVWKLNRIYFQDDITLVLIDKTENIVTNKQLESFKALLESSLLSNTNYRQSLKIIWEYVHHFLNQYRLGRSQYKFLELNQ
jgi:hypothetical protein